MELLELSSEFLPRLIILFRLQVTVFSELPWWRIRANSRKRNLAINHAHVQREVASSADSGSKQPSQNTRWPVPHNLSRLSLFAPSKPLDRRIQRPHEPATDPRMKGPYDDPEHLAVCAK